ncbi:hypothetical protein E2986_12803 [Frieseomelitta varia]|uniref:Uncharacterized protein n=1 Tax=Frieseomelitta varia TaxID=561572 RepID=A0A833RZN0_9HYME|nr:hypothetical protein E2986_12803 [Frieseomelitta varia]
MKSSVAIEFLFSLSQSDNQQILSNCILKVTDQHVLPSNMDVGHLRSGCLGTIGYNILLQWFNKFMLSLDIDKFMLSQY